MVHLWDRLPIFFPSLDTITFTVTFLTKSGSMLHQWAKAAPLVLK